MSNLSLLVENQKRYEEEHRLMLVKIAPNLWTLLPKERISKEEIQRIFKRHHPDIQEEPKEKKLKDLDKIIPIKLAVLEYYDMDDFDFESKSRAMLEARKMFIAICCESTLNRETIAHLCGYSKRSFSSFRVKIQRMKDFIDKVNAIKTIINQQ